MEGIHTVDVSLIVAPVLHEYILGAARLENIKVKERAISKDERLAEKEKAALAATVKSSLEKSTDDDMGRALLEDALEFVEEDMPEPQPEEEPMEEEAGEEEPQGLMARRGT
jgi:predicted transcriptional regulator